ncbi:hypothetical protein IKG29_00250 [Candidatus Saccharibacteria bacterium]|nr:hypothetical protein [Candidatus Saccharibacteria bacterium]MBR3328952.1 hypothetical protein [Candidatus Saccharibacteria bacterium]
MKNQTKTAIRSQKLHTPVPKKKPSKSSSFSKRIILCIIFLVIIIITAFTLFALFFKNENLVKADLDHLARDYYENYLYDSFKNSSQNQDMEALLSKHTSRGLSVITLRQLLLHDNAKNAKTASYLREYCDENSTFFQIYPEPPYEKTSYHLKFTYSCNF